MQELNFSYGDLITILALITSLGSVWRLNKEVRKPKEDMARMVEENHRLLNQRKEVLSEIDRRSRMALECCIHLMGYAVGMEDQKDIADYFKQMQTELIREVDHDENLWG